MRRKRIALLALVGLAGSAAASGAATDRIVGTWRGTSLCVDLKVAPACHDEEVVYEIKPAAGKADTVTVSADKIVNGERLPMGVIDFTYDDKDATWKGEVTSPRYHSLWILKVEGASIKGTAEDLAAKAVIRRIDLGRQP